MDLDLIVPLECVKRFHACKVKFRTILRHDVQLALSSASCTTLHTLFNMGSALKRGVLPKGNNLDLDDFVLICSHETVKLCAKLRHRSYNSRILLHTISRSTDISEGGAILLHVVELQLMLMYEG